MKLYWCHASHTVTYGGIHLTRPYKVGWIVDSQIYLVTWLCTYQSYLGVPDSRNLGDLKTPQVGQTCLGIRKGHVKCDIVDIVCDM